MTNGWVCATIVTVAVSFLFWDSRRLSGSESPRGRTVDESQRERLCAGLDSLLIRPPRWAANGAGHLAQADTSLPRHSRTRPVRHRVTLERDGQRPFSSAGPGPATPRLTVRHEPCCCRKRREQPHPDSARLAPPHPAELTQPLSTAKSPIVVIHGDQIDGVRRAEARGAVTGHPPRGTVPGLPQPSARDIEHQRRHGDTAGTHVSEPTRITRSPRAPRA